MANPDHARKLLVRSTIVTGVTVSTLVGAQSLALTDVQKMLGLVSPPNNGLVVSNPSALAASEVANPSAVQHIEPSVVILRRPGQASNTSVQQTSNAGFALPQAVLAPAPAPVIVPVQGQIIQSSGSPAQGQPSQPAQPVPQPIPQPTQPSR